MGFEFLCVVVLLTLPHLLYSALVLLQPDAAVPIAISVKSRRYFVASSYSPSTVMTILSPSALPL